MRFIRRMDEQAKAHIAAEIERAEVSGEPVDGTAIGREAARSAIAVYMAEGEPSSALEPDAKDELPAGS
jgi:hypothetical protein